MNRIGHGAGWRRTLAAGVSIGALFAVAVALPGWDSASPRFDGAALAQGAGNGAGGPSGSGSGGTSGGSASPRGAGAGGSTAGAGAGAGGSGTSTGPGSVNQNRFGGGTSVAPPPPSDSTTTTVTNTLLESLGGGTGGESYSFLDRCAGYLGSKLSPQERLTGQNLDRVNAAQVYLAPGVDPDTFKSATYLLASYQEEIDKGATDPLVAGSYLGLASTIPVTPDVVGRVNAILCVTTRAETARQIAEDAEIERRATQK